MVAENGQDKAACYHQLDRCCLLVSEVFGNPNWEDWTNSDFVRLSHTLFRQTGVQISPNTLKRIFGKIRTGSRYYPQKATRDALAKYSGYTDWEHFVEASPQAESIPDQTIEVPDQPIVAVSVAVSPHPIGPSPQKRSGTWRWLAGLAVIALFIGGMATYRHFLTKPATTGAVQLICKNPIGENPHSANFQIRGLAGVADDPVPYVIEFGDGRRKPIEAEVSTALYNHYYEKPGRYFAVLKQGTLRLDTATIYLPTKGWVATAHMPHDTTRVYPIDVPGLFVGGRRSVGPLAAARAGVDTNRTFFIGFTNTQVTDIDADNFELTTQVVTSPDRAGVRCSQVGVTIYGESSQHTVDIIKPGCVYWAEMQFSDQHKSGSRDDVRFLGADLRRGGTLTLRVVDQRVQLFINGRRVHETSYKMPLKRIYGVTVEFAGVGAVNSFSLKDLKTGKPFDGNF
ncbi:hypothetical protein FAES_4940 [Fibrella aestuarina BUZ 2]|uniref:PKD domain-containing protein n=1 Tax=Fibrella aestuarina BUZ 2 TaxID=1166018 RepID=I0KFN6_9BACT|nr:hypothetical protein [Fibrella aestuarina]CCH02939.1 hypothetical protein FAES_4940 [Fibrella aestuarina BUZ 2]